LRSVMPALQRRYPANQILVQSEVRDFRNNINSGHLAKTRAAPSRRD
jgi:hypothetical protein